jgi:RNA polymerase sigma-70 factor (ECF subfamily)
MRADPLANPKPLVQRLRAYVAYYLGDGPDADDVTSDVVEQAIRYRGTYDPAKGAPLTWLIAIARHRLRPQADEASHLVADPPDQAAAEDMELELVTRIAVRSAVAALPERDRELVALRYGADLTAKQIGEVLGVRTNVVEVALHRVCTKLRVVLAEDFGKRSQGTAPAGPPAPQPADAGPT